MPLRNSRRLTAVHAVNALFLVTIVAAGIGGVAVLDIMRAFVNGEALYSKAQKGAVIALHRYARSADPADFADYERLIAVPVSDRRAREIIEDGSRPLAEAHAFLRAGANHPEDVAGLAWLFRTFGGTSLLAEPADAWRVADDRIRELQEAARALDRAIRSGAGEPALSRHLAAIDAVDAELTRLEAAFSEAMGRTARQTARLLFLGIGGLGVVLAALGSGFAVASARRIEAAEDEMRRERELLETTLENLGEGVSVVDAGLNAVKFNRRFLELLDFPADRFAPGDPFEKFIRYNSERGEYGPGDVDEMVRARVAAARRFEPHRMERTRPDGTVLEIRGQPLPSGGCVTTYRDVTAERRVQAALEASERRIRAVLDEALDGIVTIDAEDRIIEFNPAAEAIFGHPREEALGRAMADLLMPERLRARHRAGMDRYLRTGETRMLGRRLELSALRADGEEFPVEIAVTANRAGDAPIFTAFSRDITRRKRSEDARKAAEERLWAFVDGSPEPISLKDVQGRYVLCNSAFEAMTGIPRDRLPGLTDVEVFPGQPEHHETIGRHEAEVVRTRRPVAQMRDWAGGGRSRSFLVVKFPVFGAEGELAGIGTFNQEVTELRNAEAQLRQAHKMQALGLLTGGVAHDFNNLLAVMLGNLELLDERLAGDPEKRELAGAAIGAARRGAALTQRLLAFARQQPLAPQPVDVAELLDGMSDLLRQSLGEGIRLEVRCEAGLGPCYADPTQLETALVNLAVNARDAMPDGGEVVIEATDGGPAPAPGAAEDGRETQDGAEPGPAAQTGRRVVISVTDTGEGMTPEVVDRAFEPFFTTKPVGKGNGLGLSMVYGFVEQSGGQARIASTPGRGTRVELSLPVAGPGAAAAPAGQAGAAHIARVGAPG